MIVPCFVLERESDGLANVISDADYMRCSASATMPAISALTMAVLWVGIGPTGPGKEHDGPLLNDVYK